jgi:hypothetical protein
LRPCRLAFAATAQSLRFTLLAAASIAKMTVDDFDFSTTAFPRFWTKMCAGMSTLLSKTNWGLPDLLQPAEAAEVLLNEACELL